MDSEIPTVLPWPPASPAVPRGVGPLAVPVTRPKSRARGALGYAKEIIRQLWPAYVLASILILYGFGWSLPNNPYQGGLSFHADENPAVFGIYQMQFPSLNPGFLAWGTAVFYQVWAIKGLLTLHHVIPLQADTILIIGRGVVYVYALGTLTLVFLLGRELLGTATGRMAAILLAVLPGFVQSSHYFKLDIPTTFWIMAGVLAAYHTLTTRSLSRILVMGLLFGYAASTKYTSVVMLPVGLAAIWMSRSAILSLPRAILLYAGALGVGFLVGTPYAVLRPDLIVGAVLEHAGLSATVGNSASPIGAPAWLDYTIRVVPLSATLDVAILAGAGLILSLLRRDARMILLWVAVPSYYLYIAADNYRMVHYTVPLLPLVALFAAYLGGWLSRGRFSRSVTLIASGVVVGYAFLFSLSYVQVMAEVDPRVQASEWIAAHLSTSEPILLEDTSPSDSPRFGIFGYSSIQMDYRTERVRQAPGSEYLVVSEYATRPFARVTTASVAEEQEFWSLVGTGFVEVAHFENSQKLLWLDSKDALLPITHDWLQPNPRITIYRRVGA